MFSFIRNVAADFGLTNQIHWSTFGSYLFWTRFWLDFGSILAIFLAVVCNSIHPLASIPAFAIPEAEDQAQNLTFTSGSTIYPSSITSDSALQSDSYPAATISSSTSSDFCSRSESGLLLYSTASTSTISQPRRRM
jgi:hypothetical protein